MFVNIINARLLNITLRTTEPVKDVTRQPHVSSTFLFYSRNIHIHHQQIEAISSLPTHGCRLLSFQLSRIYTIQDSQTYQLGKSTHLQQSIESTHIRR